MAEARITKNMCIPFIDVSATATPDWKRIDKSTIFEIEMNAETEAYDYISQELPTEEIVSYAPSMDQEIATYRGNPIYDFMFKKFYDCSTAHGKSLICFPPDSDGRQPAWLVADTTFVLDAMNWAEGKITWTMRFGGNIQRGSYSVTSGVPVFTAAVGS